MFLRRNKWMVGLSLLAVFGLFLYMVVNLVAKRPVMEMAKSRVQLRGQRILNEAVARKVGGNPEYESLITVHKDREGRIVLLQPNITKMNRLIAETLTLVEDEMYRMGKEEFTIPLGQILGDSILAGYGPGIKIKTLPCGKVTVELVDKFESAGINQTRHLMLLKIHGALKVIAPLAAEEVRVGATIPVTETIVVGQVPNTYMNLDGSQEIMRLQGIRTFDSQR